MNLPFVATTFHDNEPSRVYGPFPTQDDASNWLMDNLGPTDAGVVHEVQPAQQVNGKPALTAEAWMLVRVLVAALRVRECQPAMACSADVTKTINYLHKHYGVKQLYDAIDAIRGQYK